MTFTSAAFESASSGEPRKIHVIQGQFHVSDEDVVLTTEEEGIGYLAGAWLGGERGALLMQSSGAGNCINMLSLVQTARFPFLTVVTLRGDWAEFNPWQNPLGRATESAIAEAVRGILTHIDAEAKAAKPKRVRRKAASA